MPTRTSAGEKPVTLAFRGGDVALKAGESVPAPELTGENISSSDLASAKLVSSKKAVFTVKWSDAEDCWLLTGKKPGDKFLEVAETIGMIFLIGLMILAFGNDIRGLFIH